MYTVEVIECKNPIIRLFVSDVTISNLKLVEGITTQNLPFVQSSLAKIGTLGEAIVREVLEFNDIRIIYIQGNTLSVSLRNGKNSNGNSCDWEFLSDQIVRIIQKAVEEAI